MIGQMGSFERPSSDLGDVLELYLHGWVLCLPSRLPPGAPITPHPLLSSNPYPIITSPCPRNPFPKNPANTPSYVSSRIINLARNPATPKGLPLTISASHVDGLVLALTPNSHSLNYRSAILFGHATLVTSVPEKLYAMQLITDAIVPSRWEHTRVPPNAAEMQSTSVLRVTIATGSAKIRTGMPHDERSDMEDEELKGRVWTGVVPVHTVMGEPVGGPYNGFESVPSYLEGWRIEANKEAEVLAKEQLKEK
jgi:uncharacterized protein